MITASRHGLTLAAHRVFLAGTGIGLVALLSSLWTTLMLSPLQAWAPGWCSWDSDLGRGLQGCKGRLLCLPHFVLLLIFTYLYLAKPLVWGGGGGQFWT